MKNNLAYITLLFLIISSQVVGQEIDFGSFSSSYSVTLTDLTPSSDLDFGTVIQNEGVNSLTLNEAKVISIEGVSYLDVIVDVTADTYLLKDGNPSCSTNPSCRISLTMQAAYANRGQNNISQAVLMTTIGQTASAQFPVKYRGNAPPGPPPTPVYVGYNPALFNETAYVYVYGSINVGNVDVGSYEGDITVTVSYD
jgi:hypothetical protein